MFLHFKYYKAKVFKNLLNILVNICIPKYKYNQVQMFKPQLVQSSLYGYSVV